MSGEDTINKSDFFLKDIPNVKIGNVSKAPKKNVVKEQLQFLHFNEEMQEQILETLRFIHGPDFVLKDASDYKDVKTNLGKKYWLGQSNLIIKGACDFSKIEDETYEEDRLKQFALMRLESYGFHLNHCIEALKYCEGNVEDALYVLYNKYFNSGELKITDIDLSKNELLEQRMDEKSSLESIYDKTFQEKVQNAVWILTLKLDYLIKIFHNKNKSKKPAKTVQNTAKKKEKCRNFITGNCKWGDKCRFSHEKEVIEKDPNAHLTDFNFELEIRFPYNTKYPYEPPLILLKTNAVLPPLMNLHICKRLYEEAKLLAEDGIPSVYTITELLTNEEEIKSYVETTEIDFIAPNVPLFRDEKLNVPKKKRPSHYIKGITNRDNQKILTPEEIRGVDEKIVAKFKSLVKDKKYLEMLQYRKKLPAWGLMNDILNTIQQSQVVVISGETGCGKSTQVPQYILDDWLVNYANDRKHVEIVCTQPRRISAISVAERVAEERVAKIGNTVGYQIRLESKVSVNTRLTFCTTGILLRRLESEPTLPQVTHIIVDEVHERSEQSDFLLLILKQILPFRPDLKVILMSATLNAQLFSDYFGEIPILTIPGRTFPVEQYFLETIFEKTGYVLEDGTEYARKLKDAEFIENELSLLNAGRHMTPNDNLRDENLKFAQLLCRYKECSFRTCKNLLLMDPEVVNNELIETVLTWIVSGEHNYPRKGTILVFLPGIAEITSLYDQLAVHPEFGTRSQKYLVLPLHSSLSSEEQAMIFMKPKNLRKIILSTNIAETSVTIDDCVFVIDSGRMREKHFDPNRNMESLETVWVTRANALQRKGRAGRVMAGVCFHLYTSNRFRHQMLPQPIPEIHRIPLEQLILNIKILQNFEDRDVCDVIDGLIEPPLKEHVETAIVRLQDVGALDTEKQLTPLGHHLAALPVDVRIGKLLLYGAIFSCVDSALTMAACLSNKSPFVTPFRKRDEANEKKKKFAVGYSDHITVLMAYKKWQSVYKKSSLAGRNFANENFLSQKTLVTIADIKHQFLEYLVDIGFIAANLDGKRRSGDDDVLAITGNEFNRNGENFNVLAAILCAALYPNVIKVLTPPKSYVKTAGGAIPKDNEAKDFQFQTVKETVFLHPSSVNFSAKNFPSPYLVYQEKVKTSKVYFRDCTVIPVISLVLFSGFDLDISVNNGCTFISLERGWIMFQVEEHKIAEMIKMLRSELFMLLEEKIKDPLLNIWHHDKGERIITTILNLINLK
ncbi:putative ATP-dependent RNA helicase DHX57 [Tribolium castaneum]|uniref:Putative ATP-dependent RNA helicase DHX57 n=1 Tax=Tribolium castaneum TaxID=7070 RepID=D1ZZA3_TRICA|nr:PREDICTED: putative ATP-dependent RNA helicase DHX57 [Tribolium castaneum]EFA01881.1 Dosage compensation regulator-like Protein [Tribolium castaneum]|eukprot:XP_008192026.1 PREDICTED: putative ATP-dependent RNA helicase DHX57 [Tribolium castaneum]